MAEWVHVLCEVRPSLTDEEARAAVRWSTACCARSRTPAIDRETPGPGDEGHGVRRIALGRHHPSPWSRRESAERSPDEDEFARRCCPSCRTTLASPRGTDVQRQATVPETGSAPVRPTAAGHRRGRSLPARAWPSAGFAGITWPGRLRRARAARARYQRIFDQEARAFQVPPRSLEIGLGMCGPTILAHGSEEQKRALIPPLLRGEHVWCELFSEPGAGSDLASVQTRARRDGDSWSSTARRCGRRARSTATTPPAWRGPTRAGPSARASRCSSSTCTHPASRSARCAR